MAITRKKDGGLRLEHEDKVRIERARERWLSLFDTMLVVLGVETTAHIDKAADMADHALAAVERRWPEL